MTRKDYKLLSNRLKELRVSLYDDGNAAAFIVFDQFLSRLCSDLNQDNPRFESAKFRDVVYGKK